MAIDYYDAVPAVNVESLAELYEALDLLHSQVMSNLNQHPGALGILEKAMEAVMMLPDYEDDLG